MNETINYDSLLILSVVAFFTPFLVSRLKKSKYPLSSRGNIYRYIIG